MIKRVFCICLALCMLLGISAFQEEEKTFESLAGQAGEGISLDQLTAFIEIPGANILYPVMQHPTDDGFYLEHDPFGNESASGSLFTQVTYNSAFYTDPVTVIYGRRMDDESMFGGLQKLYSGSFESVREIKLYLPGEVREYTVCAAVPFSNIHIVHYYNFRLSRSFEAFFDEVYAVRRPGAQLVEAMRPEFGENVIILSTGLRGDATQRYLVIAKNNRTEIN